MSLKRNSKRHEVLFIITPQILQNKCVSATEKFGAKIFLAFPVDLLTGQGHEEVTQRPVNGPPGKYSSRCILINCPVDVLISTRGTWLLLYQRYVYWYEQIVLKRRDLIFSRIETWCSIHFTVMIMVNAWYFELMFILYKLSNFSLLNVWKVHSAHCMNVW